MVDILATNKERFEFKKYAPPSLLLKAWGSDRSECVCVVLIVVIFGKSVYWASKSISFFFYYFLICICLPKKLQEL